MEKRVWRSTKGTAGLTPQLVLSSELIKEAECKPAADTVKGQCVETHNSARYGQVKSLFESL